MNGDDLLREMIHGERDLIEDAEEVSEVGDGFSIEVRHEAGGAVVVLQFDPAMGWKCDDQQSEELDLFDREKLTG